MATVIMKTHGANFESKDAYIAQLLEMLANYPLRRDFENCVVRGKNPFYDPSPQWVTHGDTHDKHGIKTYYVSPLPEGVWSFSGNFYNYTFAFSVLTDENKVIESLRQAIDENMKRKDYKSQPQQKPAKYRTVVQGHIVNTWAMNQNSEHYLVYA